ncbi:Hypothetical protein BCD_1095 (plasmid) [Borrelia crocidurae DOU]|uniref:Uncharacterized protein n=1 Tax=Borrelia crocidurae DOU TaxID=1293575 RepID=W5SPY3_9SPIR|nr:Hypothetical protein BCD_1095 [Borrelia crocidurae DOU]
MRLIDEFDYKKLLKEAVESHFQPLGEVASSREALVKVFVSKMVEFSNSNVLATSLHAFRVFFASLHMNEFEDLVLDIINKEKLSLGNLEGSVIDSCAYTEGEIGRIIKNNNEAG